MNSRGPQPGYEQSPEHRANAAAARRSQPDIHGQVNTGAYRSWYAMKQRCLNPNNRSYASYGARGITVCERWMDFRDFFADMGPRPDGMSIERLDSNGNYEPGNCCWATTPEQNANRVQQGRSNARRKLTQEGVDWIRAGGDGLTHAAMAARLGVSRGTVSHVVQGRTWTD